LDVSSKVLFFSYGWALFRNAPGRRDEAMRILGRTHQPPLVKLSLALPSSVPPKMTLLEQ